MKSRILFICKSRDTALVTGEGSCYSYGGKSSGLRNSVDFMVDMLTVNGVECKVVEVVDNNGIDREVSQYKPTHAIIEALWVVPTKFEVLTKLHKNVKWLVRLHSEVPFIANEGIAFDWIPQYYNYPNVQVAANSKEIKEDIEAVFNKEVVYLPNYYPINKYSYTSRRPAWKRFLMRLIKPEYNSLKEKMFGQDLHVGCFGAIRPLKNQLIQAIAAMRFADSQGKKLYFHINGNRIEGKGDPVLKNIRKVFENQSRHELVEHVWMPHEKFVELLKSMDFTLQVSFTETYNIVAADSIAAGIPVITSAEITFVDKTLQADPTSTDDIVNTMKHLYRADLDGVMEDSFQRLAWNADKAAYQWGLWIKHEEASA